MRRRQSGRRHRRRCSEALTSRRHVGWIRCRLLMFLGFIAALPVLMVVGSMPSGLISAVIIFFGMQQAWKMTGVPSLQVLGPFRVGSESTSLSA